jgi:Fic family protein
MRSFVDLERTFGSQPARIGVLLSRIDVGRGREELCRDQVPELLQTLAAETKIASISASNAIEGVIVDRDRAEQLAYGGAAARFRNRNEREFAGYREAIDAIFRASEASPMTVGLILSVHRQLFEHTGGRGGHLKTDDNFIVSFASGRREVLFTPPPWQQAEFHVSELVVRYNEAVADETAHPVVLVAAFILDLLAIHPVADGNGRVARIVTTQQLLARGYGISRYVSVEQRVYESRAAYYAALYESQRGWHDSEHSIWPWVEYLATVLADCYSMFEGRISAARGLSSLSKQERVRVWVLEHAPASFRTRDVRRALPGISDPTIGLVLRRLRDEGVLESDEGRNATWTRVQESRKGGGAFPVA